MLLLVFCISALNCGETETKQNFPPENKIQTSFAAININTASAEELEKIPHIGKALALEIIEHRQRYGRFQKPEHLMLVRGISDERYREIKNLIKTE